MMCRGGGGVSAHPRRVVANCCRRLRGDFYNSLSCCNSSKFITTKNKNNNYYNYYHSNCSYYYFPTATGGGGGGVSLRLAFAQQQQQHHYHNNNDNKQQHHYHNNNNNQQQQVVLIKPRQQQQQQQRAFGGVVNHNISHSDRVPPSSEKPGFRNAFDQADSPALWIEDLNRAKSHPKNVDSPAALVEPSNHPHQYEGMLAHQRYWHYNQTIEPTFPLTPDLSKGELAAGATVTRTAVWHNPNEPAVVSIGRFGPDNFRPAGYAENAPCPDSVNSESHPDFREYRLNRNHADRRPFMYFLSASYFFVGASMMRSIVCKIAHFWWVSRDLMAAGTTEVDLSSITVGETAVVKWRGKPVFVRHRPGNEIEQAKKDDSLIGVMKDPELDAVRCPRPQWLINIGVCTHLGCIPTPGGSFGGWFCPCHGSHYDTSGRIRMGPAPSNLEIPPHEFLTETDVRLG